MLAGQVAVFALRIFNAGNGEALFFLEYPLDALVVELALTVIELAQNLLDGGLDDAGDVFVEFIIF